MKNYIFRQKVKSLLSFLCILILLPYVVTVFVNGSKLPSTKSAAAYIDYIGEERQQQVLWEEYFIGVLAKEISADCEPETLKAQAVILRTTLYEELEQAEGNQVTMDYWPRQELKKKWGVNYDSYLEKFQKAVRETENQVLLYNGNYALVPFHQSSNGNTRNASEVWGSQDYPYLTMKDCSQDKEAESEIHVYRISYQEIQEKFQADFVALEKEAAEQPLSFSDFEITAVDSAGYATEIKIRNTTLSGEQFRQTLSLASSAISLKDGEDNELILTTTGNGHGLGMSQWTANEMAKSGKNHSEILAFFFQGTTLNEDEEIITKLE